MRTKSVKFNKEGTTNMINKINIQTNSNPNPAFTSKENYLEQGLDKSLKPLNTFVKSQENLSHTRFIQDVVTNWVPKVVFTRSLADFTEMTFLEYTESALFYFAPALLGGFFHKAFSKFTPEKLKAETNKNILKSTDEILKDSKLAKSEVGKRALPLKAAIVLACVAIPAGEYALSFAKNLLTLKVFKKSDFNNVVNLNKDKKNTESEEQQNRVRESANRHIKNAGKLSAAALGGSVLLAGFGHNSEALQGVSKVILQPGGSIYKVLNKLGLKSEKTENALKKYINFDFDAKDGKLGLSKGQLVVSTVAGFFGYSEAGKDRGKLDQLEVWTRVPLVVFYTIFGSAIFDHAFKHILHKNNKFPDLVKKAENGSITIPTRADLTKLAEDIAKIKKTGPQAEYNKLIKEKAIITAIPYGFSLVFMGFLLAGITRFWTQYRFNQAKKVNPATEQNFGQKSQQSQDRFKNLAKAESLLANFK